MILQCGLLLLPCNVFIICSTFSFIFYAKEQKQHLKINICGSNKLNNYSIE